MFEVLLQLLIKGFKLRTHVLEMRAGLGTVASLTIRSQALVLCRQDFVSILLDDSKPRGDLSDFFSYLRSAFFIKICTERVFKLIQILLVEAAELVQVEFDF